MGIIKFSRKYGVPTEEILKACKKHGIPVASVTANLTDNQVKTLVEVLGLESTPDGRVQTPTAIVIKYANTQRVISGEAAIKFMRVLVLSDVPLHLFQWVEEPLERRD